MKIIIFAGGSGTRLWPLSRKNLPKQFKKMFDGKSTIQMAVDRIEKPFGTYNIYISTNENYASMAKEQMPQIPSSNIVGEPTKRDLAPAIGYNFMRLKKQGYSGPVAILWSDHLMNNVDNFVKILKKGEDLIRKDPKRLIFIGEKARYAENNLGWIHVGKELEEGVHEFIEWKYRPDIVECEAIFKSGEWMWNPGYWIVDLDYVLSLYKKFMPEMYKKLEKIGESVGTIKENEVLKKVYPTMQSISFDNAIVEKVPSKGAVVLAADMGWADPGTLYALKEALVGNHGKNYTQGLTVEMDTKDSLIINEEQDKLVATIGLDETVVVNTKDALLVVKKENVREISKLLDKIEKDKKLKKFI